MTQARDGHGDDFAANTPGADSAPGVGANPDAEPLIEAEVVDGETSAEAEQASVEQDLSELVEEARSQRDEYLDLAQRTKADFDNYRKRMAAENAAARTRGRLEVVSGVIESIDNLERVLAAENVELDRALNEQLPDDAPVSLQGVIVAYRDLNSTLKKSEVEVYDPAGENFDPTFHEALQALPAEGLEAGVVIDVMQRGYRSGETVIRPARVVVSQ